MAAPLSINALNDHTLLCQFGDLVRQDHEGNAQLLRHIEVIDRRKLWAKLGHPSMFDFLMARHHMFESTAGKRIGAARTARSFPVLFSMVASGEIHLSGIHRLKAHLTPENHEQVLAAAKHKTMQQIDELVARLAPKPDAPSTLRALPSRAPTTTTATTTATLPLAHVEPSLATDTPVPVPAARRPPDPAPLSPGRYKLQVTLSKSSRDQQAAPRSAGSPDPQRRSRGDHRAGTRRALGRGPQE